MIAVVSNSSTAFVHLEELGTPLKAWSAIAAFDGDRNGAVIKQAGAGKIATKVG